MKKKFLAFIMLLVGMSTLFVACGNDDEDEPLIPNEYLGTWYYSGDKGAMTLEISSNQRYTYTFTTSEGKTKSGSGDCSITYNGSLYLNSIPYEMDYEHCGVLVAQELWFGPMCFKRTQSGGGNSGNNNPSVDPNSVEAKLIGSWQGDDGSDEFYVEFKSGDSYKDWLIINGSKKNSFSGSYSVEGSQLTLPSGCNICNAWGNGVYDVTFSNNNNTLTLTNRLLNSWGESIVLKRQ